MTSDASGAAGSAVPAPAAPRDGSPSRRDPDPGVVGASRALGWLLVVTGAAGLLAAWVITLDK
ncbi:hypothetical protein ACIPXU_29745, partial [Streptomyces sp. NPDC090029]